MKAVQLVKVGAPLELRELPLPEPRAGEILLKVEAAGICHSDAHYRDGRASVGFLPITLGHEIAGTVEKTGAGVKGVRRNDRVALHYLITCGHCAFCIKGQEPFCVEGKMIGKDAHGGYAEYVTAPAANAIPISENVATEAAAIMMCSSSTAFHALRKARVTAGDRVAVFGVGGLGLSAVQLARACGAAAVYAVDVDANKLAAAERYHALPISAAEPAPQDQIRAHGHGRGVDVALEFTGLANVQQQALASLAPRGRLAVAGIGEAPVAIHVYQEVINREAEIIGVSDHLRGELVTLMEFASQGVLDLDGIVTDRIPLDAGDINRHLDALDAFHGKTRSVIVPQR